MCRRITQASANDAEIDLINISENATFLISAQMDIRRYCGFIAQIIMITIAAELTWMLN